MITRRSVTYELSEKDRLLVTAHSRTVSLHTNASALGKGESFDIQFVPAHIETLETLIRELRIRQCLKD